MATLDQLLVQIDASTEVLRRELRKGNTSVDQFSNRATRRLRSLDQQFSRFGRNLRNVFGGIGLTLGAAGLARGLQSAGKEALEFEKTLSEIVGLVGLSTQEVDGFRNSIDEIAKATGRGPQELADALFFITSAGARGAEALDILEASAKAAAAGLGETQSVADAVTSAVNAYGSETLSAAQATDVLVATVREGKASADTIATSLGRVIPIAAEMGVELNEVGATIAALTRVGASAEESTTALGAVLTGLLNPGQKAEETLNDFGTSVAAVRRRIREEGLLSALVDLQMRFGDNETAMANVFSNVRALRAVLPLLGANAEKVAGIFESLEVSAGATDKAFESINPEVLKMNQALASMEASSIALGQSVLPALATGIKFVTDQTITAVDWIKNLGMELSEFLHTSELSRENLERLEARLERLTRYPRFGRVATEAKEALEKEIAILRLILDAQDDQDDLEARAAASAERRQLTRQALDRARALIEQQIVPGTLREIDLSDFDSDFEKKDDGRGGGVMDDVIADIKEYRERLEDIREQTLRAQGQMEEAIRLAADRQIAEWERVAEVTPALAGDAAEAIELINQKAAADIEALSDTASDHASEFASAFAAAFESRGMDALLDGDIHQAMRGFIRDVIELIIRLTILKPLAESLENLLGGDSNNSGSSGGGLIGSIARLFSFGGTRHTGGSVRAGVPYLVKPREEFFVPNVAGRVVTQQQAAAAAASGSAGVGAPMTQNFYMQAGLPPQWAAAWAAATEVAASRAAEVSRNRQRGVR